MTTIQTIAKYLRRAPLALCILIVPFIPQCAYAGDALVQNGASAYRIALQEGASPSEHYAAEELQRFFELCTGIQLPIITISTVETNPVLLLGCGPIAQALGVAPTKETLGEQGYVMKTAAPHLVIAGTPECGTLYGVYDFLEKVLGLRWYAPGVTKTPHIATLELPQLDQTFKPAFQWRHTSYEWPGGDEAFRTRVHENNGEGGADHPFGMQHVHDGRCHSYFRFISPDAYFDEHPEYFSEIGGVRRRHETQLCLTNPEVLEIVTEKMLQRMKDMPNARQHNFSQMDYYNYCECPACTEINKRYGTLGGTQYWFLNHLAERTAKVYPDKLIGTLAYMYTEEPPKDLILHPNVAVWLCHMFPSCDSHPIDTCPLNADYKRRAEAWSKITSHLYIWHYIVNFAHYYVPFPNFRALSRDMKFYRDIGVEGIYLQGMGGGGGGGEFSLLRPWYVMQLAWNPDADGEALLKEFVHEYYGAAGPPIHEYLTLLLDKVENENIHMHLYTNPAQGYLGDEVMAKAVELFDTSEKLVESDEELLERVRVARMPLVYANSFPRNGYKIENENLLFNPPIESMDVIGEFIDRMSRHGFTTIREIQGDPQQLAMLGLVFSLPMEAPRIFNAFLEADIVPFLGGRVLRIIDKQSGTCVTGQNITRNLFFPFCGGEETRLGGVFMPEGMFYQYGISERSSDAITLMVDTGSWLITRSITLDKNAPIIRFNVEVQNLTDTPREAIVRSHTNYDLGDLKTFQARFKNRKGEEATRKAGAILAGLREGEHYYDKNAPLGEWRLSGNKGFEIIQRFPDESLDFAWLYAYPEYLNDLEAELWAKPVVLQPKETTQFTYEMEIIPVKGE